MDERLEKAIKFSNYMASLHNQKRSFQEKYYQDLIYFFNGSQFTVTKELISFCKIMLDCSQTEIILIDDNKIPTEIENLEEFFNNIKNIYINASNEFIVSYNRIKKERTIENLVDL